MAFGYDADGNRTSATGGAADRYYAYDGASRLVAVGPSPGSSSELAVVYDADGARLSDLRVPGRDIEPLRGHELFRTSS